MPDDRHFGFGRLGSQALQPADALARERAYGLRDRRRCGGNLVVLLGIDPNDTRRLRRSIAADERPTEGDRHFAEDLARKTPADRALDSVGSLGDLDPAREHHEQGTLFALVNRILSCSEVDVRDPFREMLELGGRQRREKRNARELLDRKHRLPLTEAG